MAELIDRHAARGLHEATLDTRVVVILGARQVGKSTLIEEFSADEGVGRRVLTLDDQVLRSAAQTDPAGFIAALNGPVAIDEIQRAPELMTEIKLRVDRDSSPGQFILTGSANLLEMRPVKETLAGRAEYIRLYPFSQGELSGHRESFIANLYRGQVPAISGAAVGRGAHSTILARGGFPEIQHRSPSRRTRFFESYIDGVLDKDAVALADITETSAARRLLSAIGATSASELNIDKLGAATGTPSSTVRRRIDLLEMLFLITRVPAWSNNLFARVIKRPKVHIADTGLLTHLIGADERRIEQDLNLGGMLYETFVAIELIKQAAIADERPTVHHFRDRDGREVDLVLEFRDGSIVGIEVKASATVRSEDFNGLVYLREKLGARFKAGVLIHAGADTVPFGDRLAAVPLEGLWT